MAAGNASGRLAVWPGGNPAVAFSGFRLPVLPQGPSAPPPALPTAQPADCRAAERGEIPWQRCGEGAASCEPPHTLCLREGERRGEQRESGCDRGLRDSCKPPGRGRGGGASRLGNLQGGRQNSAGVVPLPPQHRRLEIQREDSSQSLKPQARDKGFRRQGKCQSRSKWVPASGIWAVRDFSALSPTR